LTAQLLKIGGFLAREVAMSVYYLSNREERGSIYSATDTNADQGPDIVLNAENFAQIKDLLLGVDNHVDLFKPNQSSYHRHHCCQNTHVLLNR
jgi:hypothetical protein